MLTSPRPRRRRARQQQSLRQEYEEFILQRIEEFKQQLARSDLLAIADEAVHELELGPDGQLVLTEVLVLEHVDRLIMRRLNLPKYRRWREKHLRMRRAQREPTHWDLDTVTPLTELAEDFEADGDALVVGGGGAGAAYYLAAHGWPVVFIDQELSVVESVETRAATEALGARFQALVVNFDNWFPDVRPALTVLEPAALGRLEMAERSAFLGALTNQTPHGGVHYILPAPPQTDVIHLGPEILATYFEGWQLERPRPDEPRWLLAIKP